MVEELICDVLMEEVVGIIKAHAQGDTARVRELAGQIVLTATAIAEAPVNPVIR